MTVSIVEANKIKKQTGIKRLYKEYPELVEKIPVRRKAKPRKSKYKKTRSW